jgi:hypothetical protein
MLPESHPSLPGEMFQSAQVRDKVLELAQLFSKEDVFLKTE